MYIVQKRWMGHFNFNCLAFFMHSMLIQYEYVAFVQCKFILKNKDWKCILLFIFFFYLFIIHFSLLPLKSKANSSQTGLLCYKKFSRVNCIIILYLKIWQYTTHIIYACIWRYPFAFPSIFFWCYRWSSHGTLSF